MLEQEKKQPQFADARRAGVCLPISALPGVFGIGELGDNAREFIKCLARMRLQVWQFLPTGPTGYGDSPYQSLSTFAGNEMLIDVATLVRDGLLTASEAHHLEGLPDDSVDYGKLLPKKSKVLHIAAERFQAQADARTKEAFDDFLEQTNSSWLHDYALFRILKSHHQECAWPEWSAEYVHRDEQALDRFAAANAAEIQNLKVLQFVFYSQWQTMREFAASQGVMLFGDMPIYVALDSADTWASRDMVGVDENGRPDRVAGVPPDYFSEDGQLWGNPLYNWERHAADGFQWWTRRLQHSARQSDLVRIDHFRGFESYWAVPADADTARDGEWLPGPGDAFFAAMRAGLGVLPIVAEDLGDITPAVVALRQRHNIPGMKVLQFEVCNDDFNPESIDENCVCYTGTHDNDTTQGWFQGGVSDSRSEQDVVHTRARALEATQGHPDSIHTDMVRLAYHSRARMAITPVQDLLGLGSDSRINTPGTSSGNWRWRLRGEQLTDEVMDSVAGMVTDANRNGEK